MRILMLGFEYLPLKVGGLAEAITSTAEGLAELGHEVVVFTLDHGRNLGTDGKRRAREISHGVKPARDTLGFISTRSTRPCPSSANASHAPPETSSSTFLSSRKYRAF